jgi:hypothetical protein
MHPVSTDVNNVRVKDAHLVDEVDPAALDEAEPEPPPRRRAKPKAKPNADQPRLDTEPS